MASSSMGERPDGSSPAGDRRRNGGRSAGRPTAGPQVVGVDAVVEVDPLGAAVTAVILEYDRRINLRGVDLPTDVFDFSLSSNGQDLDRTVTDAYVSSTTLPGSESRNGRYVVVRDDAAVRVVRARAASRP